MGRVRAIDQEALEFILNACKASHPKEFAGVLRAERGVIKEILLVPGGASASSALLRLQALPIDPSVCGTVHSHPTQSLAPSKQDLMLFSKFGEIHIIVAWPYDPSSWRAYNHRGEQVRLEVLKAEGRGSLPGLA